MARHWQRPLVVTIALGVAPFAVALPLVGVVIGEKSLRFEAELPS